jgi:hypothetical protein
MAKKDMILIDPSTGLMKCRICGNQQYASRYPGGHFKRGSWQCQNSINHGNEAKIQNNLTEQSEEIDRLISGVDRFLGS